MKGLGELQDGSQDEDIKHKKIIISKVFSKDYQYVKQQLQKLMRNVCIKLDISQFPTQLNDKELRDKIYNFLSSVSNNLLKSYRDNVKYENNLNHKKNYIKYTEDNPLLVQKRQLFHKIYTKIEEQGNKVQIPKADIPLILNKPQSLTMVYQETGQKINLEDGLPTLPLNDYKRRMANIKKRQQDYATMYKKLADLQYVTFSRVNELTHYKNHIKIRRQQNLQQKSSKSTNSFIKIVKFKI